jgi:secreted PhoX family phosphatase
MKISEFVTEDLNRRAFLKGAGAVAAISAGGAVSYGISKLDDYSQEQEAAFLSHVTDRKDRQEYARLKSGYLIYGSMSQFGQSKNAAYNSLYYSKAGQFSRFKDQLKAKYNFED